MADRFVHDCIKTAIAQICLEMGFHSVQRSALDTFTEVAIKYIEEIGISSSRLANLAGRSEVNSVDLQVSLEELGVDVATLQEFYTQSDEIPFPKAMSRFPATRKVILCEPEEAVRRFPPSIFPHMPAFPAQHTYTFTPSFTPRDTNPTELRALKIDQTRQAESALLRIHQATKSDAPKATGIKRKTPTAAAKYLDPPLAPLDPLRALRLPSEAPTSANSTSSAAAASATAFAAGPTSTARPGSVSVSRHAAGLPTPQHTPQHTPFTASAAVSRGATPVMREKSSPARPREVSRESARGESARGSVQSSETVGLLDDVDVDV